MNKIEVTKIDINQNVVTVNYNIEGEIKDFFTTNHIVIEYDIDLTGLPESIAILPFVCNVLPIVWLTNADLYIPVLDRAFFDSINAFKQGYIDMYPMLEFKGNLYPDTIEDNTIESIGSACFFSGGLDAYATLIAHIEEKPTLITLRGADVKLDDVVGWENVRKPIIEAAKEFSIDYHFVTTTFRSFIDERKLHRFVQEIGSPDGWWHGFQHGIGLISHAAPICYLKRIKHLYIASTYTPEEKGTYTCASDPTIDNNVRFASTDVTNDQYEYNAHKKMQHVCEFERRTGHKVHMHVCWQSQGGENCCRCEKCYRRLMAVIAEGSDPNDFGFNMNDEAYKQMKHDMLWTLQIDKNNLLFWDSLKRRFIENRDKITNNDVNWIYSMDFTDKGFNKSFRKRFHRYSKAIFSLHAWKCKLSNVLNRR